MPFRTGYAVWWFGCDWWNPIPYCQVDPNASDYGVCYNIIGGKAIFFSSRTVPCESQGTCVRIPAYTSYIVPLYQYYPYAVDFSSSGKQGILKMLYINEFTNNNKRDALSLVFNAPFLSVLIDGMSVERNPPISMYPLVANNIRGPNPPVSGYDPQMNWYGYINLFTDPPVGKQIIVKYETQTLFQSIVPVYWAYGSPSSPTENIYSAGIIMLFYSYEASPELIMSLDYSEYLKYPDLRRAVGYQSSGMHPGWNASDIITLAKDIFPDRVWMVFDDSNSTLYGYGITLEQIPDWLVSSLNPASFKVLREPWDLSLVQNFISELESRNYVRSQG